MYVRFDVVPQATEEFDFPAKKAFTLIILAILCAALIYSLMIIATSMASPWESAVDANHLWGTGYVVQELLGIGGLVILVVALSMGIFTGLNGFVLASSRLLFAMSRAKIIPEAFGKLHPKYNTPHVAIIFTIAISALAPWFGREALVWVVDMSSIGVSIAYLYTCYTSFYLFKWSSTTIIDPAIQSVSPFNKAISLLGVICSSIFILLLLLPMSPAFLGIESRIALVVWIVIGVIFYVFKRKEYNKILEKELKYLILGDTNDKSHN